MGRLGAPIENKNAETWSEEQATELFNKALILSDDEEYDFIGEIARKLKTYRESFTYLSNKYESLKPIHNQILSNLEANCFSHSKTGKIKEATAIMNLKSNYRWTDRNDHTTGDKPIDNKITAIEIVKVFHEDTRGEKS